MPRALPILILIGVLLASPASAQDSTSPASERSRQSIFRLDDLTAIPLASAARGSVASTRGGDSLKNGAIAGLIVGGVIGAALAIKCGHPECGPYFGMSAGLGTAIGVGIDAMLVRRSDVPLAPTRPSNAPLPFERGRTVSAGVQKRW